MPGPGRGRSGEPRLLRTNGACERAVCLRYGQLVADLVDGRLVALLTTRYGASRSHIRQATRYLGCELVHLCVLTLGHSEPSCGVKINTTSCLLDIRSAGLPSWRRVASLSLGPSVPCAHAPATRSPRHQNGCEAEPGTCWGMLRANHFVNRHEQGVRTMVARAEPTVNSWRQDRPEQGADRKSLL